MSRAFTKEQDGAEAFDELPEMLVSEYPNLVTAEGLALIEAEVARLSKDYAAAQAAGDRSALNTAARDLRYWTQRQASAQVMPPTSDPGEVRFGARVTIKRDDGRRQTFRIVGEDEANPAKGTLSHASPLARALLGKAAGDRVRAGNTDAEIVDIS